MCLPNGKVEHMKQHVNLRLPEELLSGVELYREQLEKKTGLPVNRSDALRLLVAAGLESKSKELGK